MLPIKGLQDLANEPRSNYAEVVHILVGRDEKQFIVHKDVLCSTSEFFRRALNGDWKEASGHPCRIPDANEEAFAAYVDSLYTQVVSDLFINSSCESTDHTTCTLCSLDGNFHAYLLDDYLQDEQFCNAVIDQLLATTVQFNFNPNTTLIEKFWDMIPKSSGLRRLLVDLRALNCSTSSLDENAEKWPHDYLVDVARVWHKYYIDDEDPDEPKDRGRCYYHEGKDKPNHCKYSKEKGGRSR